MGIAKHGMSNLPTYRSWSHMKDRCINPNNHAYPDYGGRGIYLCEKWMSFAGFLADMGERPSASHSIDRIDNGDGYHKGNCRWATRSEQQRNKRKYKANSHNHQSVLSAAQVMAIRESASIGRDRQFARRKAEEFGVHPETIRCILRGGTWAHLEAA